MTTMQHPHVSFTSSELCYAQDVCVAQYRRNVIQLYRTHVRNVNSLMLEDLCRRTYSAVSTDRSLNTIPFENEFCNFQVTITAIVTQHGYGKRAYV